MFSSLTREQRDFRDSVRAFATARSSPREVRRLMATEAGYDPDVWRQMADQLGLQSLTIPERYGGSGFGAIEAAIVFEELGRTLLCSPYFATAGLAVNVLLSIDDETACADVLPRIADGSLIATLAVCDELGRCGEQTVPVRDEDRPDGPVLTGVASFVIDGAIADVLLVPARGADGVSLYLVDGDAAGLNRQPSLTLDETRKQARVEFEHAPARRVGSSGSAWAAISNGLNLATANLAAEQVGGTQALLDMSVAYAKDRQQFGRPIGSFQAIKHKCADMLLALESARSASGYAAWAASSAPHELPAAAALAKAYCSDAFTEAAKATIQIHGGIGFTWEHDAHLYLRRAKSSQVLFGSPAHHREVLAQCMGL